MESKKQYRIVDKKIKVNQKLSNNIKNCQTIYFYIEKIYFYIEKV